MLQVAVMVVRKIHHANRAACAAQEHSTVAVVLGGLTPFAKVGWGVLTAEGL
jgi:hypothetical protein